MQGFEEVLVDCKLVAVFHTQQANGNR